MQIDRVGRPTLTLLLIPEVRIDEFNGADPVDDPAAFNADVQASIEALNGGDSGFASVLASILLPDIPTVNTSNAAGFLNGRGRTGDVMDAMFCLLSNGIVTTDLVDANDQPFPAGFPYLAPASQIFSDGFEGSDTNAWSSSNP